MSINFSNRILTSVILLFILFISLFVSRFLWLYLLVVVSIISFYEFNNLLKKNQPKTKNKNYLLNITAFIYLLFFIFIGFDVHKSSIYYLLFVLSICILSDTGGYIVGKLIGGKKLTKISPNKTISGSIGSFLFSLIPIIIFFSFVEKTIIPNLVNQNIISLIFLCLFLSFVCQLGDLLISYFKRQAKVKDTGSLLPGHGGLLDRIDGIIFVLPASYILDKIIF